MADALRKLYCKRSEVRAEIAGDPGPILTRRDIGRGRVNYDKWQRHRRHLTTEGLNHRGHREEQVRKGQRAKCTVLPKSTRWFHTAFAWLFALSSLLLAFASSSLCPLWLISFRRRRDRRHQVPQSYSSETRQSL